MIPDVYLQQLQVRQSLEKASRQLCDLVAV